LRRWATPRALCVTLLGIVGCSVGPSKFSAPYVDPAAAGAEAINLYDVNKDGALDESELKKCPGLLGKLKSYDKDGNGKLEQQEIVDGVGVLFKSGVGGTQLQALVSYKGRPLAGAEVVLEPEPYLGSSIQTAKGTTNGSGATQLGIPPEFLPSHLQQMKAVHYGTFKVRITHPTTSLPAKYNTETELGYETEVGNPLVRFDLK